MLMAKYSVKCCKGKKAFIKTQKCCSIDTGFISSSYCLAIHTTGALWHFGKRALKARHIKACIFKKLFTFHIGLHLCFVMAKAKGWNSTDHQVQGFFFWVNQHVMMKADCACRPVCKTPTFPWRDPSCLQKTYNRYWTLHWWDFCKGSSGKHWEWCETYDIWV